VIGEDAGRKEQEHTTFRVRRRATGSGRGAAHARQLKGSTTGKGRVDEQICRRDLPTTKTSALLVGTPFGYASAD
jgi:hypothetical protein